MENKIKYNCSKQNLLRLEKIDKHTIYNEFLCYENKLSSLKNSPEIIKGKYDCSYNNLKDLKHSPKEVGDFLCYKNSLESFEGSPEKIGGNFDCSYNNLKNLKYSPKEVNGDFLCYSNDLKSLKGNLKEVKGKFDCERNPELKNPKQEIIENQIKAEKYLTDIGHFTFNDIKEEFENYFKNQELKNKNLTNKIKNTDYGFGL